MSLEGHLSPAKASKVTGFPVSVIYAACAKKELEHVRFSDRGSIHIPVSALEAWAAKHRVASEERPARRTPTPVAVPRRITAPSVRDLLPAGYEPQFQVSR
jgi:hypothetical protein